MVEPSDVVGAQGVEDELGLPAGSRKGADVLPAPVGDLLLVASVAVALVIGSVELLSILTDRLHVTGGLLARIGSQDRNSVGYWIVALFVLAWAVAASVWWFAGIEESWSPQLGAEGD